MLPGGKILLILLLSPSFLAAQNNEKNVVLYSVYLIGDCGNDTLPGKALQLLKHDISPRTNSTVIFLGDNVYPRGLEKNRLSEKKLLSQMSIFKGYFGTVYFIPGNHDWHAQKWKGYRIIRHQEEFVNAYFRDSLASVRNHHTGVFFPKGALPGPQTFLLLNGIRLVMMDTQWFLQHQFFHRVGSEKGKNFKETSETFFYHLDSILKNSREKNEKVILAAHHPMYNNGEHSRPRQPLRFLVNYTPFQIFGLLGLNRWLMQSMPQPRYKKMREKILSVVEKYPNVIYASGHEHNLQYFKGTPNRHIISGSGSKLSKLRKENFPAAFSDDQRNGFFRVDFMMDGKTEVHVLRDSMPSVLIDSF
jgi:hypothetical protein